MLIAEAMEMATKMLYHCDKTHEMYDLNLSVVQPTLNCFDFYCISFNSIAGINMKIKTSDLRQTNKSETRQSTNGKHNETYSSTKNRRFVFNRCGYKEIFPIE